MVEAGNVSQLNHHLRGIVSLLKRGRQAEVNRGYQSLAEVLRNRQNNLRVVFTIAYFEDEYCTVDDQETEWYRVISDYNARAEDFHGSSFFNIKIIGNDENFMTCEVNIPPDKVAPGVVRATHGSDARADFESGRVREFISCTSKCIIINPNGYGGTGSKQRGVEIEVLYREVRGQKGTELESLKFVE